MCDVILESIIMFLSWLTLKPPFRCIPIDGGGGFARAYPNPLEDERVNHQCCATHSYNCSRGFNDYGKEIKLMLKVN